MSGGFIPIQFHRPPEGDRRLFRKEKEDSGYLADALVSCCSFYLRGGFASSFFGVRFAGAVVSCLLFFVSGVRFTRAVAAASFLTKKR